MGEDMANAAQESVSLAPGVRSSLKNGWQQMLHYFLELLLIAIVGWLIGIPSGASGWAESVAVAAGILGFLGFVYGVLIVGPVDYGVSFAHLKAARGDKLEIRDMFEAFRNYWNAVLANILVWVLIGIGLVLLIIPGIVFACRLAFTPYLVVEKRMDAVEAVRGSWRMTRGYAWKVFFIGVLAIPISLAGLALFGVGIIPAIMWIRLAFASLYHSVSLSRDASG